MPVQTSLFREKTFHLGWTAGGGVEYALTSGWIAGIEYSHVDLGAEKYGGPAINDGNLAPTSSPEYDMRVRFSTLLARLSYRFDAPIAARY